MHTTTYEPGARPVLLMVPAMGVAARFYTPFVHTLQQPCAATLLTLELPGQGASPLRAASGDDFGYREVVEKLIPEAVQRAVAQHPGCPLILVGHSLGGQLALLATAELKHVVRGLVLIAAGTAHWRAQPKASRCARHSPWMRSDSWRACCPGTRANASALAETSRGGSCATGRSTPAVVVTASRAARARLPRSRERSPTCACCP
jgi:alpha-beta hydrolase superfamily lysophospholipase